MRVLSSDEVCACEALTKKRFVTIANTKMSKSLFNSILRLSLHKSEFLMLKVDLV